MSTGVPRHAQVQAQAQALRGNRAQGSGRCSSGSSSSSSSRSSSRSSSTAAQSRMVRYGTPAHAMRRRRESCCLLGGPGLAWPGHGAVAKPCEASDAAVAVAPCGRGAAERSWASWASWASWELGAGSWATRWRAGRCDGELDGRPSRPGHARRCAGRMRCRASLAARTIFI